MNRQVLLIKLGGSVITDKARPYALKRRALSRFAKEIYRAKDTSLLIFHGSGSFGHTSASKYGGKKGYVSKIGIAKVLRDASKINEIVVDALIDEGVPAISLKPRAFMLAREGEVRKVFIDIVDESISQGLVPVICGDVIFDSNWKTTIFSGEKSLGILAKKLIKKGYVIDKVIEISESGGFLNSDGKIVSEINKKNWTTLRKNVYKTNGLDVTGGMKHKIEEALLLTTMDIKTLLINNRPKNLYNAIIGRQITGTVIK